MLNQLSDSNQFDYNSIFLSSQARNTYSQSIPDYNKTKFTNSSNNLKRSNYNNYSSNIISTSPNSLPPMNSMILDYNKNLNRYENLYNLNKSRPSNYIEKTYFRNQNKLENFYKQNNYQIGMHLQGNKKLEKYNIDQYLNEIELYKNNIKKQFKNSNIVFLYPSEKNFGKKLQLTPIPEKSRLLMQTNKEKNDFNSAERTAVMLRMMEYNHGITTDENKKNLEEQLKEERYKLFLILKGAALTIEDWYINRLEKMGKKFRYNHSLEEVLNDDFYYRNIKNVDQEVFENNLFLFCQKLNEIFKDKSNNKRFCYDAKNVFAKVKKFNNGYNNRFMMKNGKKIKSQF